MPAMRLALALLLAEAVESIYASTAPLVTNVHGTNVSYLGVHANEIEGFVGIRYARDTGGENRFRPPVPYTPAPNCHIDANNPGPACPQRIDHRPPSLWNTYSYVTNISEDCLRLNVGRPNGTSASHKLPVLVYIHGGALPSR